ncbi:methyltransferase family protein [Aeoliella mucimassa]|uniref:Isoprenylcysteine carboxyl methyltransferase (ICMT) family protein n=1 Tax=Aeoliella mucimassa TaxID=2527972 RepID=A0A518AN63_9BACT|nr:isoprenylcysteine carboxylmethyltransferase family protein [Aeoliella mucimassa]QDU56146.1 Isoprenylcysteine carboxyl methyltransferase (ICMT) family protein [Aeoliella mucimassa]
MHLQSEMIAEGNWLFRHRGVVPLAFLLPLIWVVATMRWPFHSYAFHELWEVFALFVSACGFIVRVITIGHTPAGTSGRNTDRQIAEALNTKGIYSTVRHPLYLGNFLIGLGVVIVPFSIWLTCVYGLAFWLYYERIMLAEEDFLASRFGDSFHAWATSTPAFIPKLRLWRKADLSFSMRNVLKREYTALALFVLCHALIETIEHAVIDHNFHLEAGWIGLLGGTLFLYFLLRYLKNHSSILAVEGR